MAFRGLIGYEEIRDMFGVMFELDEHGRSTVYSEYLQYYCETAVEYVELMEDHGLVCDFSYMSLQGMFLAAMILHKNNLKSDFTTEDSIKEVKERIAGYYLFSMYNRFVEHGYRCDIRVNEDATGLKLAVDDGEMEICEYDVIKRLDKAFDRMEIDGLFLRFDPEEMIDVIYSL